MVTTQEAAGVNGNNLLANLPLRLPVPEGPYMQATPEPLPPRDTGGMPPWLSGAHQFAMQQFLKVLADRERNKDRVPSWQMPYPMPATQGERDVLGMLPVAGDVEDVRYLAEGVREGDPAKMLMGGAATALPFVPASLLHTVYHGSPHIFDAFKLDKIGTGEGAQAYGHGLYFAESPGVAKSYQTQLTSRINVDGQTISENNRQVGTTGNEDVDDYLIAHDGNIDAAIDELEHVVTGRIDALGRPVANPDPVTVERYQREYQPALDMLRDIKRRGAIETSTGGAFYEVDIPDEAVGRMLDWDKPLSEQPWLAEGTKDEIIARVRAEGRKPTIPEIAKVNLETPGYGDPSGKVFYNDLVKKAGNALMGMGDEVRRINLRIREITGMQNTLQKDVAKQIKPESADELERLYSQLDDINEVAQAGNAPAIASRQLKQAGIPGIRYFDAMSRGAEEGTRNLVLFDESLATILERK